MQSVTDAPMSQTANRRRWIALVVVCLAMMMNALDGSIVNVALPAIQRDLLFSQSNLTWVIDAYLISFGSFLLMAGRLGDLIGRKKVFLSGVTLFTLASIMCGLATSQAMLIAGRFIQGIGGAFSSSVIIAILVTEFPDKAERAKAMSAYIFVAVGGGSIGLLLGGILTQTINWHWIFFINVPIGVVTVIAGRMLIDENVGLGIRNGVDVLGSILITVSLMIGIYAVVTATTYGWGSAHTLIFGGIAVVLFSSFLILESNLKNPIMPLRIFKIRSLTSSSIVRAFLATGMYAVFFLGALYLEHVLDYTPLKTGLAFLPLSLVVGALSAGITANLVNRFGALKVLMPGMLCACAGLVLMALAGPHANYATSLLPAFILFGLGAGSAFIPLLTIAMAEIPTEDAGLGSGIVNVSMQMSAAIGLAVLGTLATNKTHSLIATGHPPVASLLSGYHFAFVIAAVFVGIGTVAAPFLLRGLHAAPPEATGEDGAALFTGAEGHVM
jgi:EmrB/QacA subfamily drug resistance transporter